jgi:hypothetical protein
MSASLRSFSASSSCRSFISRLSVDAAPFHKSQRFWSKRWFRVHLHKLLRAHSESLVGAMRSSDAHSSMVPATTLLLPCIHRAGAVDAYFVHHTPEISRVNGSFSR